MRRSGFWLHTSCRDPVPLAILGGSLAPLSGFLEVSWLDFGFVYIIVSVWVVILSALCWDSTFTWILVAWVNFCVCSALLASGASILLDASRFLIL